MSSSRAEQLKGSVCGYGFFSGDIVKIHHKKPVFERIGRVQWISRASKTASIRPTDSKGYDVIDHIDEFVAAGNLEKTVDRHPSTLFDKEMLKEIFDLLTKKEKVYFLYHFYGCHKSDIIKVSSRLKITTQKVKDILSEYKKRGEL
jgi:hypothetical protein